MCFWPYCTVTALFFYHVLLKLYYFCLLYIVPLGLRYDFGEIVPQFNPFPGAVLIKALLNFCRLNFWDLGGQEELQALWDKYYAECHAIIFTVDSNDRDRIQESKASFDTMIANANIQGVPLLVLANKQDIQGMELKSSASR